MQQARAHGEPAGFCNHHAWRSYSIDCLCSSAHGYFYVPVGKAANTAVKRFLFRCEGIALEGYGYFDVHADKCNPGGALGSVFHDLRATRDVDAVMEFMRGRELISVVRNPYARLLSGYADKLEGGHARRHRRQEAFWVPPVVRSFGDFVRFVADQPDGFLNLHFSSQSYLLGLAAAHGLTVGHVECLPDFLAFVRQRFFPALRDLPAEEERARHATDARSRLSERYDARLLDLVYERFAEDFRAFGYARDPERPAPAAALTRIAPGTPPPAWQLAGLRVGVGASTESLPAEFAARAMQGADAYQLLYYAEGAWRNGDRAGARALLNRLAEVANPMSLPFCVRLLAMLNRARPWNRKVNFLVTCIMREWSGNEALMNECMRFIRRAEQAGEPHAASAP